MFFGFWMFSSNLINFVASGINFVTNLIPEATKSMRFDKNDKKSK